jgi:hypothetical protein
MGATHEIEQHNPKKSHRSPSKKRQY